MLVFARDCHLVQRAVSTAGAECTYFRMPRKLALAAAQAPGLDAAMIVGAGEFTGTVADMVEARTGLRLAGAAAQRKIALPRDSRLAEGELAGHRADIERHGKEQLAGILRYLGSLGIDPDTPLCLVDLGYSATTQRALERVLPNPTHGVYWATTPRADRVSSAEGWFGEGVEFFKGNWFLDNSLLFESLMGRVEGQSIGFDVDGSPILGDTPDTDVERITRVQEAALRYVEDLTAMYGHAVLADGIDPGRVLDWVSRADGRFLPAPEAMFKSLRIENAFIGKTNDLATSKR
jgi:hypothetical protein